MILRVAPVVLVVRSVVSSSEINGKTMSKAVEASKAFNTELPRCLLTALATAFPESISSLQRKIPLFISHFTKFSVVKNYVSESVLSF